MDKLLKISRENTLSGTSSRLKKKELSQVRGELFQFLVLSLLIFSGGGNGYILNNFFVFQAFCKEWHGIHMAIKH